MTFATHLLKFLRPARKTAAASRARAATPAPLMRALEPRIVYDASAAAIGASAGASAAASHHHADADAHPATWAVNHRAADSSGSGSATARTQDQQKAADGMHRDASTPATQVVFVDPNVTDYQSLITGLPAGTRYVILNSNSDGLAQIAQYLKSHPGVESIYLISHGSEAQVQAGDTVLDLGDIATYKSELAQIGAAMKPGGNFLIYGCDVAEGSDGQALVQDIASASGLNVAASTHPVGATSLGGSWTLDYDVGNVTAPAVLSASAERGYDHLLAQTVEDFTNADDIGYDSGSTSSFTLDGITYTITTTGAKVDNAVGTDPNLLTLSDESPNENALVFDMGGVNDIQSITITMADGKAFNIQSIDIDAIANGNITFLANGQTTGINPVSNNSFVVQTVDLSSANTAFADVTSVTIEGGNLEASLGHIVYSEVIPPALTTTGFTTNYVMGGSAVTVNSGLTLTDSEASTQQNATVTITGNLTSSDSLSFSNTSSSQFGDITESSYNPSTGVLTLTSGGSSTNAQWQNALNAIKFSTSSTVVSTRTISFATNDGVASNTVTDTVDVVNPVQITTDSGSAAFVAGDNTASTPVAVDAGLSVTDADASLSTATVSISGNFHSGEDVLSFTNNGSSMGNISGSYNASTGVLTLSSASASATTAQWQNAFDSITYTDTAITPINATRTISFTATDSNGYTSATETRTVTVTDTDQTPIVSTRGSTTDYVGGTSAVTIDSSVTVSDLDNTTQASGTVSISSGFHSGDTLGFTSNAGTMGNITGSYNSATGVLTLTSSGATATLAQWDSALRSVSFSSTSTSYGNRTISFTTNDITKTSAAATDTVDVLGPPQIATDGGSAAFVAGDNVASTPVTIDSGLTLTDGSSTSFSSATVAITGNYHSGEDVLSFTNNGSSMGNIVGSYNPATGVLTLTSVSALATTAQWQNALDSITYTDTAVTPNNLTRTISFTATDSNGYTSNTATRTVTVTDTDQTPIVTTTGGTTNYVGGATAVTIDGGVTVSDLDNTTQSSGTVSISSGFHSGDTLSFSNTSSPQFGNIVGSYDAATGVLTLTSTGGTSNDTQWANALSAVKFSASSTSTPGNRTIVFTSNDGEKTSAAATDTVDVLGPPQIVTDSGSAAFVAGDNVASTPVTIDSGLTLTDGSSPSFASATVAITGNYRSGEDVLSFTNNGSSMGNITGSYDASTGVLTLTSSSASATTAQWQNALESVTYTDTAITPDNATRTISFTATDSNGNTSNTATRTVTVTDTDQTPIVTTTGGTTNYVGGATAVTIDGGVTVSDLDNTTQSSGTVSISSGFHSGDTLSFTNTSSPQFGNIVGSYDSSTGVLTLTSSGGTSNDTQWANALSAVKFSASSTSTPGNRTIVFTSNDGEKTSAAATDTVDVLGPPQIVTDSGSAAFVAGDNVASTPVTIDSGVTLTDGSSPSFASATVAITGNFHSGEDVLAFTNNGSSMGNIAGSYNASTGVLTLTSAGASATIGQWQSALDSIKYTDTAVTPNNATRTISFTAVDTGANISNTATRTVTVTDTDQTPIVSTTGGTTNYVGNTPAATIDSGITVSDLDNTTQASGTVSIGSGFHSGDTLSFVNDGSTMGNIVGSYNSATGVLTLTSSSATATRAQWDSALQSVSFSSSSTSYGDRTIAFTTNDGMKTSAVATDTVNVIAPVTLTTDSGSAAFVAGDNTASTPVAIDSGLALTDGATTTFASATVSITGNFHSGEDVLGFTNDGSSMGNITASYNASTGVLTLTSASASATTAQWQSALDSVTYTDTAITPNNATRTISFSATDSGGNTSNTATRTVTVADTDQTPIVTTSGVTTNDRSGSTGVTIDSGITVSDLDNTTQASATVSIGAGFQSGDTLSFANTGSTAFGNIAASYDASTGVLTLTSSGATATNAQWASALSSVTFSSTSTNYGERTISFATSDGTKTSASVTDTVDVTNAMSLSPGTGSASFVEGDNAAGTPVAIGPDVTLTDTNASALPESATIAVTGNFHSGEDVLSFTNTNAATFGDLSGSYNAATGVLTLTSASGHASAAQWQSALDAVTYADTAVSPATATRTISFSVADGNGSVSNAVTRTVTVTTTDQSPIVTTTGATATYADGRTAAAIDGGIAVSDLDNTTQSSATVSIGTGFHSGDVLGFSNTSASTFGNISASYDASTGVLTLKSSGATATNAQWAHALSAVTFSSTSGVDGSRAISFVVSDGQKASASASDTVSVNTPPASNTSNGVPGFVPVAAPPDHAPPVSPEIVLNPVGDEQSNAASVLAEFDDPRQVGATPSIPTITFSDALSSSSYTAGRTSVPPMVSLVPDGLSSSAELPPAMVEVAAPVTVAVDASGNGGSFTVDISSIDGDAFADATDVSVSLADGNALPAWLHFDAANGTLNGAMPGGTPDVHVLVQVRDASGHVIRREIVLAPNDHGTTGTSHMASPHASIAPAHALVREASLRSLLPAGKPSLAHQFAAARAALHVARPAPVLAITAATAGAGSSPAHNETGSHA